MAPYYLEEVRKYLEAKYGAKALYESGLTVRTSLDPQLQRAANAAIDHGLRQVARRRGAWRKPGRNVLAEGHKLEEFKHDRWSRPIAEGDIVPAVVIRRRSSPGLRTSGRGVRTRRISFSRAT